MCSFDGYSGNKIKNLGIVRGRDKVVNLPAENIDPFFDFLNHVTCFPDKRYSVFEDVLGI